MHNTARLRVPPRVAVVESPSIRFDLLNPAPISQSGIADTGLDRARNLPPLYE